MNEYDYGTFGEDDGEPISMVANAAKYTKEQTVDLFKRESDLFEFEDNNFNELTDEQVDILMSYADVSMVEEIYIKKVTDEEFDWIKCCSDDKGAIRCWEIEKASLPEFENIEVDNGR